MAGLKDVPIGALLQKHCDVAPNIVSIVVTILASHPAAAFAVTHGRNGSRRIWMDHSTYEHLQVALASRPAEERQV